MSNATKDLVGEMIPTLCEKFMGRKTVIRAEDGRAVLAPLNHAEDACELFDALDALKREQKIRAYVDALRRGNEALDCMRTAVRDRQWKMAQTLAATVVTEMTQLPLLPLVVLMATESKALVDGIDRGAEGFEAFERFAVSARTIINEALDVETDAARMAGRDPELNSREKSELEEAARDLFDNRLGWDMGRQPYAPRAFWARLGAAIYGSEDKRVAELRADPTLSGDPRPA